MTLPMSLYRYRVSQPYNVDKELAPSLPHQVPMRRLSLHQVMENPSPFLEGPFDPERGVELRHEMSKSANVYRLFAVRHPPNQLPRADPELACILLCRTHRLQGKPAAAHVHTLGVSRLVDDTRSIAN